MEPTTLKLTFPTPFGPVEVGLPVDDEVGPVTDVAAAARTLSEAVATATQERLASAGRTVSCAAGCSMCCHHLVGVSPIEALLLAAAVRKKPADEQEALNARRDAVVEKLAETGLRERIEANPAGAAGREAAQVGLGPDVVSVDRLALDVEG